MTNIHSYLNNYININRISDYCFKVLQINTLIYILALRGEQKMIFEGCFISQLWGELAALTVVMAMIFGTVLLCFA